MSGMEATKVIQEMGYAHPIVALTANEHNNMNVILIENGFWGVASKLINIDKFDVYLVKFIRDKKQATE